MPIDYDKLLALDIPDVEHAYTEKDTILYALGLGLGHDPMDEAELAFVCEKNLKALPTFAMKLAYTPLWLGHRALGLDWHKMVHGEAGFTLHRPIAPKGDVTGRERIIEVIDKGEGKGALIYSQREVLDKASGAKIATLRSTVFARGAGGFGGPREWSKGNPPALHPIPERAPDLVCDLPTRPEIALIYRLSGDTNPLHVEPAFAKTAGFPRPILHGLATFGIAGHAILKTVCGYDPSKLTAMDARFSAPVFPGETIRTEIWRDANVLSFRARVIERDIIAINNGRADVR
jgi:acyl dehydratase